MDFFIRAGYAAEQLQNKAMSDSESVTESFFDDYRVLIMSLSLLLSLIVFGWQIYKHFHDKKTSKKDYALSIEDGYWHQSVVLPLFVDKFVSSITQWVDAISSPDKLSVDEIRDNFKKDIRELASRTQLLCTVKEQARANILMRLEEVEDCITCYLSDIKESPDNKKSPPNNKVFEKAEAIFKELMQDHQSFNR